MKKKNNRTKATLKPKLKSKSKPKTKKSIPKKVVKKIVKKAPKNTKPSVLKESVITGKIPNDMALLEQFFGGPVKLKLWKVFALNTSREFTLKDLARLTKIKQQNMLIENLRDLMRQGVIQAHKKSFVDESSGKQQGVLYRVSKNFPLLSEITQLILTAIPRSAEKVLAELQSLQRLKTVLLAGFFTSKLGLSTHSFSATQSPIDMLLIFEKIPANVTEIMAELEHKLGRDLRYAALDEVDFKYRHSIGDKLIRDVLDFEHFVAMDKMSFFK